MLAAQLLIGLATVALCVWIAQGDQRPDLPIRDDDSFWGPGTGWKP